MKLLSLVISVILFSSVVLAQENVSQEVAAAFISNALDEPAITILTPKESNPAIQAVVSSKEDIGEVKSLILESIRDSTGAIPACFDPHHILKVNRGKDKIYIRLCFHCVRGCYWLNDHVYWFTISRNQESRLNNLFHKYGVPGSEPIVPSQH